MTDLTVWDGDSDNRDSDNSPRKAPDWQDWGRLIEEVAGAQTRVNANGAGRDDNALHTFGAVTTKTGLSIVEKGDGAVHKTVFTFDEMSVASVDGSTPGTDGAWGTQTLYTFPAGHVAVLGAHAVFPLAGLEAVTGGGTGFADAADFGIGVGSVAASNQGEFGLSTTEEDICAEMDIDLTSKTSDAIESVAQATVAVYDGSTTPIDIHLNFRCLEDTDHGTTADALKVSGTLTILWSVLGDD